MQLVTYRLHRTSRGTKKKKAAAATDNYLNGAAATDNYLNKAAATDNYLNSAAATDNYLNSAAASSRWTKRVVSVDDGQTVGFHENVTDNPAQAAWRTTQGRSWGINKDTLHCTWRLMK